MHIVPITDPVQVVDDISEDSLSNSDETGENLSTNGADTDNQQVSPGANPHADSAATEHSTGSVSAPPSAPGRTTGATSRPSPVVADNARARIPPRASTDASFDDLGGRKPSPGARSPSSSSRGVPASAATRSSSDSEADVSPANRSNSASGSSVATPSAVAPETHQYRTRLQQGIKKPKKYTDGTIRYGLSTVGEPNNLTEALEDTKWKHAMDEEYTALMDNKTWHLVPPSSNKNLIDCKWVYRVKKHVDGIVERYKARLVAKGFKHRYGID
jgi:hypothetical protein